MKVVDRVDPTWLYENYYGRSVEVLLRVPMTNEPEEWHEVLSVQRQHSSSSRYEIMVSRPGRGGKTLYRHQGHDWFTARWEETPRPAYEPRTADRREIRRGIVLALSRARIDGADPALGITDYVLELLEREDKARG